MNNYEKIRNHRNQVLYKGDVPLCFGCEFEYSGGVYTYVDEYEWVVRYKSNDSPYPHTTSEDMFGSRIQTGHYKILGTPITLQEVLVMMEEVGHKVQIQSNGAMSFFREGDVAETARDVFADYNLTKSVEHQSKETLEAIVKLLEHE